MPVNLSTVNMNIHMHDLPYNVVCLGSNCGYQWSVRGYVSFYWLEANSRSYLFHTYCTVHLLTFSTCRQRMFVSRWRTNLWVDVYELYQKCTSPSHLTRGEILGGKFAFISKIYQIFFFRKWSDLFSDEVHSLVTPFYWGWHNGDATHRFYMKSLWWRRYSISWRLCFIDMYLLHGMVRDSEMWVTLSVELHILTGSKRYNYIYILVCK